MQACSNYTQTNHLDYSVEQLRLPLDLSVAIDKYDPLWSFLEVIKEVNLKKFLKPHRGNQGHNSLMMMKVVLFAYMNQVYSLRQMEERCRNDIRFLYLSEEERPSHMAFQRFINNQLKGNISDIFTEITETIFEKTNADTRILYLDGTMMEANANKFTFVWKKTAEKSLAKSICRIKESIALLESETGLKYGSDDLTPDKLRSFSFSVYQYCSENKIPFVYGKGKRKRSKSAAKRSRSAGRIVTATVRRIMTPQ